MFSRILLSTFTVASLLAATPALAGDPAKDADVRDVPKCCEQLAMQHRELLEQKNAPARTEDRTNQRVEEDDPYVRNQSWGG